MTVDEVVEALHTWRENHKRRAWRPVTKVVEPEAHARSAFGGLPWLQHGEHWPSCGACGRDMHLFLQLDFDELPEELRAIYGSGLLQFFYCTDGGDACHRRDWEPFDSGHLARVLPPGSQLMRRDASSEHCPFPPKAIIEWQSLDDFPHPEEHASLGLSYCYDFRKNTVVIRFSQPAITVGPISLMQINDEGLQVAEAIGRCVAGDKLGGWPNWIQGAEYPVCPECGQRMELMFQVDSMDNVPFMFGDSGCGHITRCPSHPQIMAFCWACC